MTHPTRLDKRLVELLGCSRAEARQYIEGGWVSVDGRIVEAPQTMVTTETVKLDPEASAEAAEPATLLLHKPSGTDAEATAALLEPERRAATDETGVRPLHRHLQRLVALAPLEDMASGLVVFSQDWRVRRLLQEDLPGLEQEFVVEVQGTASPWALARLAHGLAYRGRTLPPCKVSWQSENRLRFAIKDVQPGQLQGMCRQVGLEATGIRRLRIGRIGLSKMPEGQWRYLGDGRF